MTYRCPGCHQEIAITPRAQATEGVIVEHWMPDEHKSWIRPWRKRADGKSARMIDAWFVCSWSGARVKIG